MKSSAFQVAALAVATSLLAFSVPRSRASGVASNELEQDSRPVAPANPPALPGFGTDGLSSMFRSLTDMSSFVSSFSPPRVTTGEGEKGGEAKDQAKETSFMGIKDPMEFFRLMLDPMKFMGWMAKQFKLDKTEFTQSVGRGMNFGLETALQPPLVCVKIIEKVFVPDACKLKFVCEMGRQLAMFKGSMPKFPDSFFEGASTAKALYDGATGRECEHVYDCKEGEGPTLKKEFASLKKKLGGEQNESGESYQ